MIKQPRARRAAWIAVAICVVSAAVFTSAGWRTAQAQQRPVCLSDIAADAALVVEVASRAPSALCESAYRVIEIRNRSGAPLGGARLELVAPSGPQEMPFEPLNPDATPPVFFEMSDDDGATWEAIDAPVLVGGTLVWTAAEAPMLARLGPNGTADDSILLRWRAPLGDAYGDPFSPAPAIRVSGSAVDNCGTVAVAPASETVLTTLKPSLSARLVGRNVTRGGPFSESAPAAPGDLIEWRLEIDNNGDAAGDVLRARLTTEDGPLAGAARSDGVSDAPFGESGVMTLEPAPPGGRRAALFRASAPESCGRAPIIADLSYGCGVPPAGARAAAQAEGAIARGWIVTAPEPTKIRITPSVSGASGQSAPGAKAVIRVIVENDGAPAFDPVLEITAPDGFEFSIDAELDFFATAADATGRVIGARIEDARDGSARLRFDAADGAQPVIGAGDRVEVRLTATRTQRTMGSSDEAAAALAFVDGCGAAGRTLTARARTPLRQARLEVALAPEEAPVVLLGGGAKRFVVDVRNTGDAPAETITVLLEPGGAWRAAAPEGCVVDPQASDGGGPRFRCVLDGPLEPGASVEARYDFATDPGLDLEDEAILTGGLTLRARALARAANAEGAPTGAVLAEGRVRTSVIGFSISQRLTTPGGEPLDLGRPIDLGQQVALELEVRWLGGAERAIEDAALALFLPSQLGFISVEQMDGGLEVVGLRSPAAQESGQLLWSFASIGDSGFARFRVVALAIDDQSGERDAFAASLSQGEVAADAIFSIDGLALGVDAAEPGPTRAEPLALLFRRPDLRIDVFVSGAEKVEPAFGPPSERDLAFRDGVWFATPGRLMIAEITLTNSGAGPGYFDWLRLEAPRGVEILPFGSDRVDNDGDGLVDEADETAAASLEPLGPSTAPSVATEARWSGAGGGSLGGGERLIRPKGARLWRAALRIGEETPPGRDFPLSVEAQFGAQPVQRAGGGVRSRVLAQPAIRTAPIDGWLALTGTSFGQDIESIVRAGEQTEHRLTLRLPPGLVQDLRIKIDLDPAFGAPERADLRFGAAVSCSQEVERVIEERSGAAGRRLLWALGDCVVDPAAPVELRGVIVDIDTRISDADPATDKAARASWRKPAISAIASYKDPFADLGRTERRLGAGQLTLKGPALRLLADAPRRSEAAAETSDEARLLDGGDRFEGRLRLVNVGDDPTSGAVLRYGWRRPQEAHEGVDCAALEIAIDDATAQILERAPCMVTLALDFSANPLEPGQVVELGLRGGLTGQAPIASAAETPLQVLTAPTAIAAPFDEGAVWIEDGSAPEAKLLWSAALRAPDAPEADVARGRSALTIGDPVLARGRYSVPEGRGPFDLVLRLRLKGRDGRPTPSAEILARVLNLTLSRSRADMNASSNPSRVNDAVAGGVIRLAETDFFVTVDPQGWTEITVPMGEVSFRETGTALGEGVYTLEVAAELLDVAAVSRGRQLAVEAALRRSGEGETSIWRSEDVFVASIAEPFLDLAALHADPDGSAQLGERVLFIGRACNRGEAPAYGAAIAGDLPAGFALDPGRPPVFVFDDGPEALGPRPYGEVRVDPTGRVLGVGRETLPIEPGACVALRVPSFARRPAAAARAPNGVFTAPTASARFEILSYRGRASATRKGRLYSGLGPSMTAVVRRDLVIDAPKTVFVERDGWIYLPFAVRTSEFGAGGRLSLVVGDDATLAWTIFLDANRDGQIDAGDQVWRDGAAVPQGGGLAFVARARVPERPPIGWRRPTLLRAAAVTPQGDVLTGAREVMAARGDQRDGVMTALRLMAVDRDCDGELKDEAAQDAAFERTKNVAIGECVTMRIVFRNDGAASVERVHVEDVVPSGTRYLDGTATFASTPAGLVGSKVELEQPEGVKERLKFRFVGALAPGLEGVVEYRIRVSGAG